MQNVTITKSNTRLKSLLSKSMIVVLFFATLPVLAQDKSDVDILRRMGKAFASIAEKASPAVVGLKSEKSIIRDLQSPYSEPFDPFGDDFFEYFFRRQMPRQRQQKYRQLAQGSGFIISPDGFILTNNHLAGDSEKITVTLNDGREFEAKVIGADPDSDVAVIKIDANNLPFLETADSDKLEVGEWVLAIGNPFGLAHTVTAGIVSAKGRSNVGISTYEDFIQTDAAINPGNSGGPMLNLDGRVVGINSAILSRSGGNLGIGFAIPINMAKSVYEQLVQSGTVTRGYLGVTIQDLTPELAKSFGLKDTRGVLIPNVTADSAAEKGGIKQGDIITELDGVPVEKTKDLLNRVAMLKPGTRVEVVVLREGKRKTLTVEVGTRPKSKLVAAVRPDILEQLGISVQNLTPDVAERFGYKDEEGVIVTDVEQGSLADFGGITPGTLIVEVNRKAVKDTDDLEKALEASVKEGRVLFLLKYGQSTRYLTLTVPKR
jgi:serine protease Do